MGCGNVMDRHGVRQRFGRHGVRQRFGRHGVRQRFGRHRVRQRFWDDMGCGNAFDDHHPPETNRLDDVWPRPTVFNVATAEIPSSMMAMVLTKPLTPLQPRQVPVPRPKPGELLVKVEACAVCRTDLHVVDGELPNSKLPLIPGHEIVGTVCQSDSDRFKIGERVGIPWLGWTCGCCWFCLADKENLCENALFTGYTRDGGYAEFVVADEHFFVRIPRLLWGCGAGCSFALCRADWLPLASDGRHSRPGQKARHLWIRSRSSFSDAGCDLSGTNHFCFYPSRRQSWTRVRETTGSNLGPAIPINCHQSRWMPPSFSLRPDPWFRKRSGQSTKAERWCAAGFI